MRPPHPLILAAALLAVGRAARAHQAPTVQYDVAEPITQPGSYHLGLVRVHLRYARASDLSRAFGGGVIQVGAARWDLHGGPWGYSSSGLRNMVPPGVNGLTAYDTDNSLIIDATDSQDLDRFIALIRALDVSYPKALIAARTTLRLTDHAGRRRLIELAADGTAVGGEPVHLKSVHEGGAGLEPAAVTSDLDVAVRRLGDGTFDLRAAWYVDVVWPGPHGAAAKRLRNAYRTHANVRDAATVTVTHVTIKLPSGAAELTLQITPRAEQQAAPAPDSGANNAAVPPRKQ